MQFWINLREEGECIALFTDEELLAPSGFAGAQQIPITSEAGAVLPDIDRFDAAFFGFRRAKRRSWIRSTGCSSSAPGRRSRTPACDPTPTRLDRRLRRLGASSTLLRCNLVPHHECRGQVGRLQLDDSATTRIDSLATTRLLQAEPARPEHHGADRLLDLAGRGAPGLPEPARSASATWRSPAASSIARPARGRLPYQEGGIVSPDGHCRAFDAAGARERSAAAASASSLLKPLDDALADGDHIHAVIRGSAVNNDGVAQGRLHRAERRRAAAVIAAALARAGVEPETHRLRRGARHRHAAGRSDRGRTR